MSITSVRAISIAFTGGEQYQISDSLLTATNTQSPGINQVLALTTGTNTITVPAVGLTVTAATFIPPVGNTNLMTLKGVAGDTGIALHKTNATSIAIDTTVATFVINAAAPVNLRVIWT